MFSCIKITSFGYWQNVVLIFALFSWKPNSGLGVVFECVKFFIVVV